MLRNYLLIAIRNLRKHRLYSFINIGGLAVGLAACLLIVLFVRDELSYDTWLPNAERIGKLQITYRVPGREPIAIGTSPAPAKAPLEKDFSSDIESVARIYRSNEPIRAGDKQFNDNVAYADAELFEVFDLPVARGVRQDALANNASLLLSERMAEKYFGDEPAIGQVMTINNEVDYTVVGVFDELPRNTHLELEIIALFDTQRYLERPWVAERWSSSNVHTYILFRSPESMARVESDLDEFVDRNVTLDIPGFENARISELIILDLLPVLDIHLHAKEVGSFKDGGDVVTVITFSAIAVLILLIACINFVNLATARSMQRAREVAMRKVVGATRQQLVSQFLGEAILTALFALLIALALVELALAPYNSFLDKEMTLDFIGDPMLIVLMLGLVVIVGMLGGLYPAIYLSRFRPARVLKANQSSASGSTALRNSLVVFQFAVSIGLIVATAIVYGQTSYARGLDLGIDTASKLVLGGLRDIPGEGEQLATLKREITALADVEAASLSSDAPPLTDSNNTVLYPTPTPGNEKYLIETLRVDHDFFALYGIEPLAGRLFSKDFPTDLRIIPADESLDATQSIVVNETFLAKLGIASPEEAIGLTFWDSVDLSQRLARTTIIGVVPDMYLRSLHFNITPLLYYVTAEDSDSLSVLSIDVAPGQMAPALAAVEKVWSALVPGVPIRATFVDEDFAALYDATEKRGRMFGAFAIFAVLIACLGLFGLASFAAERRTKEIGVRKVLGASSLDIVRLLMWQLAKPVLIANAIAWPVSFFLMDRWLTTFEYHIDLTDPTRLVTIFGGAGVVAMAIAWLTVAGQAARVARASPIHALRCE